MADIFDYLERRGKTSLAELPFHEVDGVVLARYAYIPFELVEGEGLTLRQAAGRFGVVPDLTEQLLMDADERLLNILGESDRFGDMTLLAYENELDEDTQTQFAAITIKLEPGLYYVCFRGTDNTLVGWKEDFNMTFVCPVPAQTLAASYFQRLADRLEGRFILGGHSKGGNLAVYAAACAGPETQNRIEAVYNYDGPGFQDVIIRTEGYRNVCGRVRTFVPQTSIFGMMLGHEEAYTIVHSGQLGPFQHDVYSWEIEGDCFTHLEAVTESSRRIDFALKQWIHGMNSREREQFADAVYTAILSTHAHTLNELTGDWFRNAKQVLKSLKNLDSASRKLVTGAMRALVHCVRVSKNLPEDEQRKLERYDPA